MPGEREFGEHLADQLRPLMPKKYTVETARSLLYSVAFDDQGSIQLGQNKDGEPTRGGGTGFEQDLVIFQRVSGGQTSIVPRVSVELKFESVSTHDSIVYSEKARRIRAIYPFVRYGLILGGMAHIPARTLRLGTEFDFIVAVPDRVGSAELKRLVSLLRLELRVSTSLTAILKGRTAVSALHRQLKHSVSR